MNQAPFTAANPLRLAIWSGPRNISTALMRSWGNRDDTFVCDEPLYAHYLAQTQRPHPMAAEVMANQENDWRKVAASLTGEVPGGKAVFYQKQMSHHLLPNIGREWLTQLTHAFLIRDPREVLVSLDEKFERPQLMDTGYPQQIEIFEFIRQQTGTVCPVVDARDILTDPRGVLIRLCAALGLPFQERMLQWPAGTRATDGLWAKHWYDSVNRSTGFQPYAPKNKPLPEHLRELYEACLPFYE
ncbi:MAG: hypothetical protein JWQ04_2283 [Pedosphaera sp.]|nr:hypothetical protein [Pedosphaera sp.]